MSNDKHISYARITHIACDVDIPAVAGYARTVNVDPIYKQIGEVIRAKRKTLGMTQHDLAKKLGISRGSLANVETGRQNMLVHQLYAYADALQLRPTDLVPDRASVADWSEIPLPSGLKPNQKAQLARLISGGGDEISMKGRTYGSKKR